jgi:hypothetical protein
MVAGQDCSEELFTAPSSDVWSGLVPSDPRAKVMQLVADIQVGGEQQTALDIAGPLFESLLDILSFAVAAPIPLGAIEVLDITPPLVLEEERAVQTFGSPPFDRNAQGVAVTGVYGIAEYSLPSELVDMDSRTAARPGRS